MQTYIFDVTVVAVHNGEKKDFTLPKGFRAESELAARRNVLNDMLGKGYQVRRIVLTDTVSAAKLMEDADGESYL